MHIIHEWEQEAERRFDAFMIREREALKRRAEAKWRRRTYFALAVFTAACWWLIISFGIALYRWMR